MEDSINGFSQREKAFEARYLHDEELNFRIKSKRDHLFGLWAAHLLRYADEKAEKYAEDVMMVAVQRNPHEDVLHKVLRDLEAEHIEMSEHRLQKEFERCWETAQEIVMNREET